MDGKYLVGFVNDVLGKKNFVVQFEDGKNIEMSDSSL